MLLGPIRSLRPLYATSIRILGAPSFHRNTTSVTASNGNNKDERQILLAQLKEELPKPYDGPERDLVNFPRIPRPQHPDKVRHAFLPEEWFQFFYKKTGVTGPYVFGAGLLTFLLSKEWYVVEEELSTGVALFILCYVATKKWGAAARKWADDGVDREYAKLDDKKVEVMKQHEQAIANEKKSQWYASGQTTLMEAKRENVQMQLEAEYRTRSMHVYNEIKKRLDYQMDLYNTQKTYEQKHLVDWVVNNVMKSITPQQEKDALLKCIEDLKGLSAQAH